jgi:hypothetical protein
MAPIYGWNRLDGQWGELYLNRTRIRSPWGHEPVVCGVGPRTNGGKIAKLAPERCIPMNSEPVMVLHLVRSFPQDAAPREGLAIVMRKSAWIKECRWFVGNAATTDGRSVEERRSRPMDPGSKGSHGRSRSLLTLIQHRALYSLGARHTLDRPGTHRNRRRLTYRHSVNGGPRMGD